MRDIPQDHIVTFLGGPLHRFTNVVEPNSGSAYLAYSDGTGNYGEANRGAHYVRQTITGQTAEGDEVTRDFMVLVGWDEDPIEFIKQNPRVLTLMPLDAA